MVTAKFFFTRSRSLYYSAKCAILPGQMGQNWQAGSLVHKIPHCNHLQTFLAAILLAQCYMVIYVSLVSGNLNHCPSEGLVLHFCATKGCFASNTVGCLIPP